MPHHNAEATMRHLAYISDKPLPLDPEELPDDLPGLQRTYDMFLDLHHEDPRYTDALDIIQDKMRRVRTQEPEH